MRKILLIRNDRFGEFLLNIPAFRAVKDTYPAAELHIAVAPGVAELARAVPGVDKVLVLPVEGGSFFERMLAVATMRREKYDAAMVLNPTAWAHQMLFWSGIPVRVGYDRKHSFFLTRKLKDVKGLGRKHEVENNLDLAAVLGCSTVDCSLALNIPEDLQEHVIRKWGLDPLDVAGKPVRYVAVHPWTSDPVKQWPLDNFAQVVSRLAADNSCKVVIIGREEAWHKKFTLAALPGVIDLRGRTTLLEAAAVLKQCAVLLSCDSGPVHLAACVGTPVVALFRNDMPGKNPERWGPWGRDHKVIQKPRLADITVDEVCGQIL
ncbi:MAG: glycosyltransferase family 9 protein [Candidatus Omnitrophica bacterium]|nr:glycosyltransferase family 9 protein [Candidatus Omnitrophota bacterium]